MRELFGGVFSFLLGLSLLAAFVGFIVGGRGRGCASLDEPGMRLLIPFRPMAKLGCWFGETEGK